MNKILDAWVGLQFENLTIDGKPHAFPGGVSSHLRFPLACIVLVTLPHQTPPI